jgi:hypothetical protein
VTTTQTTEAKRAYGQAWRASNPEKVKAYAAAHYAANRDAILAKAADRAAKRREVRLVRKAAERAARAAKNADEQAQRMEALGVITKLPTGARRHPEYHRLFATPDGRVFASHNEGGFLPIQGQADTSGQGHLGMNHRIGSRKESVAPRPHCILGWACDVLAR